MKNSQSRRMSLMESLVSVMAGYVLTVMVQFFVFPLFGVHVPMTDALLISMILVLIAFAKNYSVRRLFNYFHQTENA